LGEERDEVARSGGGHGERRPGEDEVDHDVGPGGRRVRRPEAVAAGEGASPETSPDDDAGEDHVGGAHGAGGDRCREPEGDDAERRLAAGEHADEGASHVGTEPEERTHRPCRVVRPPGLGQTGHHEEKAGHEVEAEDRHSCQSGPWDVGGTVS